MIKIFLERVKTILAKNNKPLNLLESLRCFFKGKSGAMAEPGDN